MFFLQCHSSRYKKANRSKNDIKYIVVHYTANNGDTALNNLKNASRKGRAASAHFFVDEKEACQSVAVKDIAWHCGTSGKYKHANCRNANSIGVEMCSRIKNGVYYFLPATVENTARLVADLMAEYDLPLSRVIRHYDVTGKLCPRPYVDEKAWAEFKALVRKYAQEEKDMVYYKTVGEIPFQVGREVVADLVAKGIIAGVSESDLHLSEDMVRILCYLRKAGSI